MAFYECDNIYTLDLDPKVEGALKKAHLTDQRHILTLANSDLERLSKLSSKDVHNLKDLIAERLAQSKPVTAFELLHNKVDTRLQHWKLKTMCETIDKVLRGGLLSGVVTEVSGESACGKTQLCLQLCISIQLNKHHSGGAVYICTEDVFPSKRLQQLIRFYSSHVQRDNLGDKVLIEHVADFETLDFCIKKKLPVLLKRGLVRLVIIDSVTALFRCHYDATETFERAKHLTSFASLLHRLAFEHSIPVVCVNQVSAAMSNEGSEAIPALGLTWANQIACRITLSRLYLLPPSVQNHKEEWKLKEAALPEPTYRKLKVIFAPHIPPTELVFYIDHCGIHGILS